MGFPGGACGKELACQCRRLKILGFSPWVGKIPWRRAWQPTPVFLSGDSHGERNLVGYTPWGSKELDMSEVTWRACTWGLHGDLPLLLPRLWWCWHSVSQWGSAGSRSGPFPPPASAPLLHLSVHPFAHLSIHLPIHLSIWQGTNSKTQPLLPSLAKVTL